MVNECSQGFSLNCTVKLPNQATIACLITLCSLRRSYIHHVNMDSLQPNIISEQTGLRDGNVNHWTVFTHILLSATLLTLDL